MSVAPSTDPASTPALIVPPHEPKWKLFWQAVTKFEKNKIVPEIALRNAIGVTLPLIIGILAGYKLSGLAVASGALNASFSDGADGYTTRSRRMLAASLFIGLAVFAGGIVGRHNTEAVLVATVAAFAAGMVVSLGTAAGDIGVITLVTFVVYSAQSLSFVNAAWAGLLALGGALLQTGLALVFWPVQPYGPERRSLGSLFLELAHFCTFSADQEAASPAASGASTAAQQMISQLGSDHRVETIRYRSLLNQAGRARLCLLMLRRLEYRIAREGPAETIAAISEIFATAADILYAVGSSLSGAGALGPVRQDLVRFTELAGKLRDSHTVAGPSFVKALIADAQLQVDALGGQLRVIVDLTESSTVEGFERFEAREKSLPYLLRFSGALATLRANLTLNSTACRHAIRLAVCLSLGEALGRIIGWGRAYWLPMTIAIVLKPDFTSTFSRGVLRLLGTFLGLVIATLLFHLLPPWLLLQAFMAGLYTLGLRWIGPANYGIFVIFISGLVVILIELTGISAREVVFLRAFNTAVGGLLALVAYIVWPTWERHQLLEQLSRLIDAYRSYLQSITSRILARDSAQDHAQLEQARLEARLARSNAEASIGRVRGEPGADLQQVNASMAFMAASHRFVHALMALDAGLSTSRPAPPRDAFKKLAADMDLTLYLLTAVLRGSPFSRKQFPDLRAVHNRLVESGDSAVERYALSNVETDRMTNSVNTMRECVARIVKLQPAR